MMNMNLKEIEMVAEKYCNDAELIKKAIKSVQSKKCRLAKQKGRSDYEKLMTECLQQERILVEAKLLVEPKGKTVPEYEQADVDRLDYDETMKAIKTIQSKKYHSRWLTDVEGDNDEFRQACKVEAMLLAHKENIKPVDEMYIRKSELVTIIDTIESSGEVSTERILEMLKNLL